MHILWRFCHLILFRTTFTWKQYLLDALLCFSILQTYMCIGYKYLTQIVSHAICYYETFNSLEKHAKMTKSWHQRDNNSAGQQLYQPYRHTIHIYNTIYDIHYTIYTYSKLRRKFEFQIVKIVWIFSTICRIYCICSMHFSGLLNACENDGVLEES